MEGKDAKGKPGEGEGREESWRIRELQRRGGGGGGEEGMRERTGAGTGAGRIAGTSSLESEWPEGAGRKGGETGEVVMTPGNKGQETASWDSMKTTLQERRRRPDAR
jgi:hypothetical protein